MCPSREVVDDGGKREGLVVRFCDFLRVVFCIFHSCGMCCESLHVLCIDEKKRIQIAIDSTTRLSHIGCKNP